MPTCFELQSTLHAAIIMDGNGRWALGRGLPRAAGHRAGVEAARRVVDAAPEHGIGVLTLFAFSSDNWRREPVEVAALMRLLAWYLESQSEGAVAADGAPACLQRWPPPSPRPKRLPRAAPSCGCAWRSTIPAATPSWPRPAERASFPARESIDDWDHRWTC